jgi:hypothetical protein
MKTPIENLKQELREYIELSKTITQGKWEMTGGAKTPVNCGKKHIAMVNYYKIANEAVDIYGAEHDANATFIARSRNISPAMAECLLVAVDELDSIRDGAYCDADHEKDCQNSLQQILTIWENARLIKAAKGEQP